MTKRLAVVFAMVCLCAFARDWKKYPALVQMDGATELPLDCGPCAAVTTGDMIDKGPRALDVIRLLRTCAAPHRRRAAG